MPTMSYHRGDVVLVLFPDSNLRTSKRRPALVVQSDQLRTELAQTIVAMITSNMARCRAPEQSNCARGERAGSRSADGFGNHDRQPCHRAILGD
ncbi:MAG: type II toxin-antitoxin system PemK/MazF family toxin [Bryobacteraceae bacterium]